MDDSADVPNIVGPRQYYTAQHREVIATVLGGTGVQMAQMLGLKVRLGPPVSAATAVVLDLVTVPTFGPWEGDTFVDELKDRVARADFGYTVEGDFPTHQTFDEWAMAARSWYHPRGAVRALGELGMSYPTILDAVTPFFERLHRFTQTMVEVVWVMNKFLQNPPEQVPPEQLMALTLKIP